MKYILITGSVISRDGEGIIASSLGIILKSRGVRVTCIKIDPYINIDAGTFSPQEHGEVFVLDDGGEVDLDLGNYERFLDITLTGDHNITTGKIYQQVINKERKGDYLGKTVRVVPHITNAIQDWVSRVAEIPVDGEHKADVCIIELGGTIDEAESLPFVEAFNQFLFKVTQENICYIHVCIMPQAKPSGEQKTKPAQSSLRELMKHGISPNIIICRSVTSLAENVKEKLSLLSHVEPHQVYCVHDVTSPYGVPLLLQSQGADEFIIKHLRLNDTAFSANTVNHVAMWKKLADRHDRLVKEVCIVLVGKYVQASDAYASVIKALQHASLAINRKLDLKSVEACDLEPDTLNNNPQQYHDAWRTVNDANGVIVPGDFGGTGIEGKILACEWARSKKVPFLGVCLGLQCAVIEFARNELKWEDANSAEFVTSSQHPVVIDMPEHNQGDMAGAMRLGKRKTIFRTHNSILRKLYHGQDFVEERHRHRYEVNPTVIDALERKGLKFVGCSEDGERMDIMELDDHPYYTGVQYHPEYISRPMKPSPPYLGLLLASCNKLQAYIKQESQPSTTMNF